LLIGYREWRVLELNIKVETVHTLHTTGLGLVLKERTFPNSGLEAHKGQIYPFTVYIHSQLFLTFLSSQEKYW
jgi:hypothetical protein